MPFSTLDLLFLAVVLLFALHGMRKGLILSLCSLVALVVAAVGATFLTNALTPLLTRSLVPLVETFLLEHFDLESLLAQQGGGLLGQLSDHLLKNGTAFASIGTFAGELAQAVVSVCIRPILFSLCFAVVLVLWHCLSRALDLVARLPVLHLFNKTGGLLFGALSGALVALLLLFLMQTLLPGKLPQQWVENSFLLGDQTLSGLFSSFMPSSYFSDILTP